MNLKKVPKDDYVPEQHGPVYNFFYSLKTHYMMIMSVNFLFMVFNIPMMLLAFAYVLGFLPYINSVFVPANFAQFMFDSGVVGNESINDVGADAAYQIYYLIVVFCVMFLLGSCLMVIGPFQAGFSQIYRNLYRQEGVFIFTDFKEGMKNNWKQSLVASLISLVVTALCLLAMGFYLNMGTTAGTAIGTFFVILFFIFIVIQNIGSVIVIIVVRGVGFIHVIMVVRVVGFIRPVIIIVTMIVIPALLMVTTTYAAYAVVVVYYLTFIFGVDQYVIAFFTGELMKEYMDPKTPVTEQPEDMSDLNDEEDLQGTDMTAAEGNGD